MKKQKFLVSKKLYTQLLGFNHKCTGCPKKNALLTLEANTSGLEAPIGKSWTSFENYMFSAFIWAQEQVNSIPASLRKLAFKKITWTILIISFVLVQVIFKKHDFLRDAGMELACSCVQLKAENMSFSKLVLFFPIGA